MSVLMMRYTTFTQCESFSASASSISRFLTPQPVEIPASTGGKRHRQGYFWEYQKAIQWFRFYHARRHHCRCHHYFRTEFTKNRTSERDAKINQTKKGNQWYHGMNVHALVFLRRNPFLKMNTCSKPIIESASVHQASRPRHLTPASTGRSKLNTVSRPSAVRSNTLFWLSSVISVIAKSCIAALPRTWLGSCTSKVWTPNFIRMSFCNRSRCKKFLFHKAFP